MLLSNQSLAWGAWVSVAATAGTGQVTAGSLATATAPTPAQVPGGRTVGLSWTSVTDATSYVVRHYTLATGGTGTVVCTPTTTSCVDGTNRAGNNNWYSVQARVGSLWVGAESLRTRYTADTTTATPTITALGSDTGASTADYVTRTASNTLIGTSEANATVVISRGAQIATATANSSGVWTSTAFTLNEGTQPFTATATDAYGNSAISSARVILLDTVVPAIGRTATCATPGNAAPTGNWCRQTSLSMTATFADTGGSGLQSGTSEYNNDGAGWTDYTGAVTLAEDNGRVVQLRATDIAGNQGLTSVTYYIDGTNPAFTLTAPLPPNYSSITTLNNALAANCGGLAACGTSSDAISAATVRWQLVRNNDNRCYRTAAPVGWGSCTGYALQNAGGAPPAWTLPVASGSVYSGARTYTGTIQSTDQAGNVTTLSGSFSVN